MPTTIATRKAYLPIFEVIRNKDRTYSLVPNGYKTVKTRSRVLTHPYKPNSKSPPPQIVDGLLQPRQVSMGITTFSYEVTPQYSKLHGHIYVSGYNENRINLTNIPVNDSLLNESQTKFYNEAREGRVNLLNLLATRKETVDACANVLDKIAELVLTISNRDKLLRSLKKGLQKEIRAVKRLRKSERISRRTARKRTYSAYTGIRQVGRELGQLQLTWSFGFGPLYDDLKKLTAGAGHGDTVYAVCRGRAKSSSYKVTSQYSGSTYVGQRTLQVIERASTTAFISMKDPLQYSGTQLGLNNVAATLWEVTPWSYAVDYILPIGDWLDQFTILNGLTLLAASRTYTCYQDEVISDINGCKSTKYGWHKTRTIGMPKYLPLEFQNPFTSLRRGLNQISVIVALGRNARGL